MVRLARRPLIVTGPAISSDSPLTRIVTGYLIAPIAQGTTDRTVRAHRQAFRSHRRRDVMEAGQARPARAWRRRSGDGNHPPLSRLHGVLASTFARPCRVPR